MADLQANLAASREAYRVLDEAHQLLQVKHEGGWGGDMPEKAKTRKKKN